MQRSRAIILSDIHLGPGVPLTVFGETRALSNFLRHLAEDPAPTELVLAGDVFDFLQSPNYRGFDAEKAPERFAAIAAHNEGVLSALKQFAAAPNHEVTLLSGNHDPEVLLPSVRHDFEQRIDRRDSVRYDEPLATGTEGYRVWGRALHDEKIWVVHGDRWDPHNAIDRDQILREGKTNLPPGSHLVFEVLAKLPQYPWCMNSNQS